MNQAINPEGWVIGKTATGLNHLNWGTIKDANGGSSPPFRAGGRVAFSF